MSRLIIKNLPKNITEDKLKNKFNEKGIVTDVQLKYTKDGKFRHFAFIGYQSKQEAEAAIQYFNKSFFNSVRITVEPCAELGDENKPKPWSKYAVDSTAYKKLHGIENVKKPCEVNDSKPVNPVLKELSDKLEKLKDDPKFLEYLEIHGKDKTVWGNDDITSFMLFKNKSKNEENIDSGVEDDQEQETREKKIAEDDTISDADYLKLKTGKKTIEEVKSHKKDTKDKYFTLVMRGLPYKTKKKDIKSFFRPLKVDSIRIPTHIKGIAYLGFKVEKNMKKALLRDRSFIDGKRVFVYPLKANTDNISKSDDSTRVTNEKWKNQEDSLKMEEDIAESGRIFVRNLPYTTTEEELQPVFEKHGPLSEVIVPIDKVTRKIKGFAVVTFLIPEHAVKAYTELDGTVFHGRMLHLIPGKAKNSEDVDVAEGSSFKTKKVQKLKTEASSSYNWNTLFLGHNAVADVIASNYNTTKEEVLSGNNAAVRLALGETQIVQETKEFLEQSGVKLDAFNRAVNHRSKNVILVKNLPANTKINEIRDLFCKYGVLGRLLLPPNCITAIVEFVEPTEARTAFRRLAYSRFKNLPLYLEWAPEDTLACVDVDETLYENKIENAKTDERNDDEEQEPDTTLFIKNLNFDTTEAKIEEHFKKCGKVASVTVARKKDPKKPGSLLSMGYGFIQFYKQQSLNTALKTLQQSTLDDHCVELKRSNRTLQSDTHLSRKVNNVEKQTGCKILVRNIPFQAKQTELHELFKTFGDIKALRLPKKMIGTGPHRGFAFVDYYSKEDAKQAMHSLCQSTHLYGRRLVLEWAQSAEEDIEQLRKRTADRFPAEKDTRSKKSTADTNFVDDEDSEDE